MNFDTDNFELYIFDCDGTLVDSMPMWGNLTFDFADYKGIEAPENLASIMNNLSLIQCAQYYVDILHADGTPESVAQEITDFAAEGYVTRVPEKKNARAFLEHLREKESTSHLPRLRIFLHLSLALKSSACSNL